MSAASSNDVTFNIYKKDFKAGEKVVLGTNGQSAYCVNYTVLVKEYEKNIPEKVIGDVNADESFGLPDIVLMQKYLLNIEALSNYEAGDASQDGKINIFDLSIMKQMILEK